MRLPLLSIFAALALAPGEAACQDTISLDGDTAYFSARYDSVRFNARRVDTLTDTLTVYDSTTVTDTLWCRTADSICTSQAPATLEQVTLSPASLALVAGASQQFSAAGRYSNNNSVGVSPAYTVTGGSMSPEALYTAGPTAGSYRVIASLYGRADTTLVTIALAGVPIAVGDNWQAKNDANPAGTLFRILAGRHIRPSVKPRTGNSFVGDSGAVMDGENVAQYAFTAGTTAPYPSNVTIKKLEIKNYKPANQSAAIRLSGDVTAQSSSGWTVDSNNVHHSSQVGIRIGTLARVRWNTVHHNATFGLSGPGDDALVEGNTVTYNGDTTGVKTEDGGSKFVRTNRLVVRGNTFAFNEGNGIWLDIANRDFQIYGNTSADNFSDGIAIEISYNGAIYNNILLRNGLDDPRSDNWPWGAGIGIKASGGTGIEVYGNTLTGNANGIGLIQQPRGTAHADPAGVDEFMLVNNVWVHDNTITMQTIPGHLHAGSLGASQVVQDFVSTPNIYSAVRNNRFERNSYSLNGGVNVFAFNNSYRNATYWKATAKQDTTGTFVP